MRSVVAPTGTTSASPDAWRGFDLGDWCESIAVRDFIVTHNSPYLGEADFLAGPTPRTRGIWAKLSALFPEERDRGVLGIDTHVPGSITSHAPGYIDRCGGGRCGLFSASEGQYWPAVTA